MQVFKVICPRCAKRLFDIADSSSGTVQIKCPRCKTFSIIDLITAQRGTFQATEPNPTPTERN